MRSYKCNGYWAVLLVIGLIFATVNADTICGDGKFSLAGISKCYSILSDSPGNWSAGLKKCEALKMTLLQIESDAENEALTNYLAEQQMQLMDDSIDTSRFWIAYWRTKDDNQKLYDAVRQRTASFQSVRVPLVNVAPNRDYLCTAISSNKHWIILPCSTSNIAPICQISKTVVVFTSRDPSSNISAPTAPVQFGYPWLYYATASNTTGGLYRARLVTESEVDGTERLLHPFDELGRSVKAMAYDCMAGAVYWSDGSSSRKGSDGRICREDVQRTVATVVYTAGVWILGLTVDPTSRTIYWSEASNQRIMMANIDVDQLKPEIMVAKSTGAPWGVAVYTQLKKFMWAEPDQKQIKWSDLKGENVQTLYSGTQAAPSIQLAMLHQNQDVCFVDYGARPIQCSDREALKQKNLTTFDFNRSWTVRFFRDTIYWSDIDGETQAGRISAMSTDEQTTTVVTNKNQIDRFLIAHSGCAIAPVLGNPVTRTVS